MKEKHRPVSEGVFERQNMRSMKLLREIDFANYKIENLSGRKKKEKNVR